MWRILIKTFIPILILSAGGGATYYLIENKKPVKSRPAPQQKSILVRTLIAEPKNHRVIVKSQGTTEAFKELSLSAEVGGKVIWMNPELVEGGRVDQGDLLLRLDPQDYQLNLDQVQASLVKAAYDIDLVLAQKKAAEQEQKILQSMPKSRFLPKIKTTLSGLALYEPQLRNAQAGMEAVKITLKQAELNLRRTQVFSPFDAYVRMVSTAEGQSITAKQTVATMFTHKPILIKVSLPLADLDWFHVGSTALISKKIGNRRHQWKGRVKRLLLEIDNLGRLAKIVIEVPNPRSNYRFSLPLGLFVDVAIQGETLKNVISIPHSALHAGSNIWKLNGEDRLEIQKVVVTRKNDQEYLFSNGLHRGERIIISPITAPIPGMKLVEFQETKAISQSIAGNQTTQARQRKQKSRKTQAPKAEAAVESH